MSTYAYGVAIYSCTYEVSLRSSSTILVVFLCYEIIYYLESASQTRYSRLFRDHEDALCGPHDASDSLRTLIPISNSILLDHLEVNIIVVTTGLLRSVRAMIEGGPRRHDDAEPASVKH